jgi:restriction endonuclease S subunit
VARVSTRSFLFFRLSPVDGNEAFAIRRGELISRWDVKFNKPMLWRNLSTLFPTIKIKNTVSSFSGGTPSKMESSYWNGDIPWVSAKEVNDFEISDTEEHLTELGVKAARLKLAEIGSVILVFRSSILCHTLPVAVNTRPLVVNQDIKVLLPYPSLNGRFLAWYLTVFQERLLPIITKQSTTVHSINTNEFEELEIPVPPLQKQHRLVTAMDEARSHRKQKLAESDVLLSSLDDYLLNTLGLEPPVKDERKVFAIQTSIISGRFDPHFHAPNFKNIYRLLSKNTTKKLGEIVKFSKDYWNPKDEEKITFRYIEISNVKPQTGEAIWTETLTKEAPSRARMLVHGDDIIVSLTRPHHGSIAHLSEEFDGCIASTGFAVIRSVSKLLNREYLWCILRSQLSLQQMLQRASGGNYPAITRSELENIIIPIPEISIQEKIVREIQHRRSEAQRLRSEAETGWQIAKQWFEDQLLGGS